MADSDNERMDFDDLEPVKLAVGYGGKKYFLCEADTDAATKYRNSAVKAARLNDGKVERIEGIGDVEPLLVSLCLRVRVTGPDQVETTGAKVDLKTVLTFPSRVTKAWFGWIKKVSDLDENETEEGLLKLLKRTQEKLDKLRKAKAPTDEEGADTGPKDDAELTSVISD